jgi:hypothetical protein
MSEEQERHSQALEAELVSDPDEKARVEARNGVLQMDAVTEMIEYYSPLSEISSSAPLNFCTCIVLSSTA